MALLDRIIAAESGGNPYATNSSSSAGGLGQFIDSTWLEMLAKYRPDLAAGRSRDELLSLKFDPALSREMTAAYGEQNASDLRGAGLPVNAATTYLAHFAGPKGAIGVLSADPATPVGSILGKAAMTANPFLSGMTAGDLISWAGGKVGGQAARAIPPSDAPIFPTSALPPGMPAASIDEPSTTKPEAQSSGDNIGAYLAQLMDDKQPQQQAKKQPSINLGKIYAALGSLHQARRAGNWKG